MECRPEPEQLTSQEILAFLNEHDVAVTWIPKSVHFPRMAVLTSDDFKTTRGLTVERAVCLAAAKWKEANDD